MPWLGIWFEPHAGEDGPRSPELLRGLVPPIVFPYARNFIESEEKRLLRAPDPGGMLRDRTRHRVYYSLGHDGGGSGIADQGCAILHWLFRSFDPHSGATPAARFSEIPIVIHSESPARAAALGNAITLLRFLGAGEDQAIAKILLHPWDPLRGSFRLAAEDYERRVLDFLHGEIFYPEGVSLFDVLDRNDLKAHRDLAPCCQDRIGFILPLLEWIEECRPRTPEEEAELIPKLRNSLADEARTLRRAATR